jgi:hypothetical protein
MRCGKCGTELEHTGQGHTCGSTNDIPDEPPTDWTGATWAMIVLLVVVVLSDLANGALRLAGDAGALVTAASAVWVVGLVGVLVMTFVWNHRTRLLAEAYSADKKTYVWSLGWHTVALAPMLLAILTMWRDSEQDTKILVGMLARAVVGVSVLVAVLVSRARVQRLIRDSAAAQVASASVQR